MNILLIGKDAGTERLLSKLGQGHSIVHCADGARAFAELRNGSTHYDWIVVQGMARTLSSMEIASAIRAMGIWAPIAFLCDADQLDVAPQQACAVRGFVPQVVAGRWAHTGGKAAERVVEYHAPIKRRERRF